MHKRALHATVLHAKGNVILNSRTNKLVIRILKDPPTTAEMVREALELAGVQQ